MNQKLALLTCLVFMILVSCKKNNNIPGNASLNRIKQIVNDTLGGTESFVFDNEDRIISVQVSFAGTQTAVANISYGAGTIVINPVHPTTVEKSTQISYSIDGNGLPLIRTSYDSLDYDSLTGNTQRDYIYDTTQYFYNAQGLIVKKLYTRKDSTYFDPGGSPQIIIDLTQIENDYTYNGEFLTNVTRNSEMSFNTYSIVYQNTVATKQTQIDTWNFNDSKHFPNKWDYNNQVVIQELGFLPDFFLVGDINKINSALPSGYQHSSITKDENGTVIGTGNDSKTFDLSYSGSFMTGTQENGQLLWQYEYK
jgi:hypothetical protein